MRALTATATISLLTAEFLWTTENAASGEGLYLVVLWLAVAAGCCFFVWRNRRTGNSGIRLNAADWGILLIVSGHCLSTTGVFLAEGDRRSALNLTAEWIGLSAAWGLLRWLSFQRDFRQAAVASLCAVSVGLGAYGIWQHHIFYPQQAEWYATRRTALDDAIRSGIGSAGIVAEFQAEQIPLDGPARILWENRLLSSTEPFGTFSLANTLAGILAAAVVLLVSQAVARPAARPRTLAEILWFGSAILTVSYCLLLTKSRSAWAGAVLGLLVLVVLRSGHTRLKTLFRWGMLAGILAGSVTTAALVAGILDKEVILESPKSLQFRLFYWFGSLRMLREHAVLGAGPGNFRQLYLMQKLDESSEEIRDPHNFLVDAWSSSGLCGLWGTALIVVFLYQTLRQMSVNRAHNMCSDQVPPGSGVQSAERQREYSTSFAIRGMAGGFLLHAVWVWLNGYDLTMDQVSKLLLVTGLFSYVLLPRLRFLSDGGSSGIAAAISLCVHLLAAGGFEMPAVMLTVFVGMTQMPSADGSVATGGVSSVRGAGWLCVSCGCLGMCFTIANWGVRSCLAVERASSAGEFELISGRGDRSAIAAFRKATESDPWSVPPRQRIAELEAYRLKEMEQQILISTDKGTYEQLSALYRVQFSLAMKACEEWLVADRRDVNVIGLRGRCRLSAVRVAEKVGEKGVDDLLEAGIYDLQEVTKLYPSSIEAWVDLVEGYGLDRSGKSASRQRSAAARALKLDQINREWGHRELCLSEEAVELLKSVAETTSRDNVSQG